MDLTLRHALTYNTKGDVPIPIVAKELLANDRLLRESMRFLERCAPGLQIKVVGVRVSELSNASPLKQILSIALFMTFQEDLQREVPDLIEKLMGVNVPDNADTVVTVLVVMVAMYLVDAAVERVLPGKAVKELKKELEGKIEWASRLLDIPKATIEAALSQLDQQKTDKALTRRALELFLPAKIEQDTTISLPAGQEISAAVIREIPLDVEVEPADSSGSYEVAGAVVEIHRADRDQNKHGWRAVVESVSERKVRMELDQGISPDSLYGTKTIIGDVTVIEGTDETGQVEPRVYVLNRVRSE